MLAKDLLGYYSGEFADDGFASNSAAESRISSSAAEPLLANAEHLQSADIDEFYYADDADADDMHAEDYTLLMVRYVLAIVYSLLFMIGLANVLVLFIVARFSRMRTVTNVFIFNLCMADLVYVTFIPFVVCFQLMRSWIFGEFMCKIFFIAESTTKFASVYFVGVLSVDRYLALCHPSWCKRHRSPMLAIILSAVGWLITAALMTPIYLYSTVLTISPTLQMCIVKWPLAGGDILSVNDSDSRQFDASVNSSLSRHHGRDIVVPPPQYHQQKFTSEHYFAIYSFIFCFGAPLIVIISFYFKILEELIRANERAARLKKRKEHTYKKVTRMVLSVVTFYFICWSPFWIMSFVSTFVLRSSPSTGVRILFNIIHALPYLNCSINPILYSLMTETFRIILGEVFPWTPCFKRSSVSAAGNNTTTNLRQSTRHKSVVRRRYDHDDEMFTDNSSSRFLRSSFSHSVRMMSTLSINFTGSSANGQASSTLSVSPSSAVSSVLTTNDSGYGTRNFRALSVV